jgi:hypothetical protein
MQRSQLMIVWSLRSTRGMLAAHKKKLLYKLNWSNSTRRKNFFCSISSKICSFFFLGVLTKLGMTILTG